jgi:hypothetical protein
MDPTLVKLTIQAACIETQVLLNNCEHRLDEVYADKDELQNFIQEAVDNFCLITYGEVFDAIEDYIKKYEQRRKSIPKVAGNPD